MLSNIILSIAIIFLIIAMLGILRSKDVLARIHFTSMVDTMVLPLSILYLIISSWGETSLVIKLKLALLVVLSVTISALATHVLAKIIWQSRNEK